VVDWWTRHQSDGGERLDEDDGQAGRRDYGHRLSVRRWPEDRQAREGRAGRRQGDPRLRPLGLLLLSRYTRPTRRRDRRYGGSRRSYRHVPTDKSEPAFLAFG